jgi:hypothetical protein
LAYLGEGFAVDQERNRQIERIAREVFPLLNLFQVEQL